jgi:hypothetical protein
VLPVGAGGPSRGLAVAQDHGPRDLAPLFHSSVEPVLQRIDCGVGTILVAFCIICRIEVLDDQSEKLSLLRGNLKTDIEGTHFVHEPRIINADFNARNTKRHALTKLAKLNDATCEVSPAMEDQSAVMRI